MYNPLALFVGLRYTQAKRRNQYISFVSLISLLGMILGVFALIVVLSIMNGFEAELRGRILSLVPHGFIRSDNGQLSEWERWRTELEGQDTVVAAAPFIDGNVMVSRPGMIRGAQLNAIDPTLESQVSQVADRLIAGSYDSLEAGSYGVIVGDLLARYLGLGLGDTMSIMLPKVTITPLGIFPRVKRFTIVGLFKVGAQLDSDALFIHLKDGQKLFQYGDSVAGLRVKLHDLQDAQRLLPELARSLSKHAKSTSWETTQGSLFQAMKMEKAMTTLLLLIIVVIAAFNIISILTIMVADKRSDIAVLRTMGASPNSVMAIFMIQGITVGCTGILIGVSLAIPAALNIGAIVTWIESLSGLQVFNPDIYFISQIPSVLEWTDVYLVAGSGVLLSTFATIYPAIRAAKVHPAEVLRYE